MPAIAGIYNAVTGADAVGRSFGISRLSCESIGALLQALAMLALNAQNEAALAQVGGWVFVLLPLIE